MNEISDFIQISIFNPTKLKTSISSFFVTADEATIIRDPSMSWQVPCFILVLAEFLSFKHRSKNEVDPLIKNIKDSTRYAGQNRLIFINALSTCPYKKI